MSKAKEPARDQDPDHLVDYVRDRVLRVMERMRRRKAKDPVTGKLVPLDPVFFEGKRSKLRQYWNYGKGRTVSQCEQAGMPAKYARAYSDPDATVVTYTLDSKHLKGKASDVVSGTRLWSWPAFYVALKEEGAREGLHVLGFEGCHLEWRG